MSSKKNAFQSWKEVIIDFLEKKKNEKLLKEIKKEITTIEKNLHKLNSTFLEEPIKEIIALNIKKNENYIKKIKAYFSLDNTPEPVKNILEPAKIKYKEFCEKLEKEFEPVTWIEKASNNIDSISFATHVSKLTHSKINTPSICDNNEELHPSYLTTSSLLHKNKKIDGAVSGNQYAPIFQFLELEFSEKKLAEELSNTNNTHLACFSEDLYKDWNRRFLKVMNPAEMSTHLLAKQIYFPTSTGSYHLLVNLVSSSLAHAIYLRSASKEFFDRQKPVNKQLSDNKYSPTNSIFFPKKGKLSVTASNHSNASQLNGNRGGKLYLLPAAPPNWNTQIKAPIFQKSFFASLFLSPELRQNIENLQEFLFRFDSIGLSIRDPKRRKWIDKWLGNIIEEVLFQASVTQNLDAGWTNSKDIRLKKEHQLFLDPYRSDDFFVSERNGDNWQIVLCKDFARWLNNQLVKNNNKFSPQAEHSKIWFTLFETELRKFNEITHIAVEERSNR